MPFGPLSFASPWLLLALAALPALWWLLKITPPAAKRTPFPALRLLIGLEAAEETPARTPLWLAMLRLILGAFIIFALAHPILGGGARFEGKGPVLLVIDDGWTAAPDWAKRQAVLQEILTEAERETRTVAVLTTAPPVSGEPITPPAPLRAAEARKIVQAVEPKPWPADRPAAAKALESALGGPAGDALRKPAAVIWLADGLDDQNGAAAALAEGLSKLGSLRFVTGELVSFPHLLLPPETETGRFVVKALRPDLKGTPQESVQLHALDDEGHVLAAQPLVFPADSAHGETTLDLPADVANQIARLDIEDEPSAGATFLLDERWKRRTVGLVSATPQESDRPLLGDLYYLKRALEPFSDVHIGTLGDLLKSGASVLALPDSIALTPDDRKALEEWISKGGVLLRFAGPHMAESADLAAGTPADELIPVSLRRGGRALGGVMSWTAPMALAPFDPSSPFAGLKVPADVTIERQVLAEPSLDLGSKTWAQLADGTPLVTAERHDQGTLILFHITANADWSNLPLSGLFVDMLRRIVALSHGGAGKPGGPPLPPFRSLDGFGKLGAPPSAAIAFDAAHPPAIGPKHPPGFYGSEAARVAVNVGNPASTLLPIQKLPANAVRSALAPAPAFDLKPWLWLAAFLLALTDLIISLGLRGLLPRQIKGIWRGGAKTTGAIAVAALSASLLWTGGAIAQDATAPSGAAPNGTAPSKPLTGDDAIVAKTSVTRLAYVRTGDSATDQESEAGLRGLTKIVDRRTAAEMADPVAIDIENDEILFFPLLYWPVSVDQPSPSAYAVEKINQYLATGGIILFDTHDSKLGLGDDRSGGFSWDAPGAAILRRIAQNLRIPPLVPLPAEHVLTKSYYLMQEFPGRFAGGSLWVASEDAQTNDGVSPVIVGGNDWAGAWALNDDLRTMYPVVPGGAMQREQAFRFGINLVMYALTGNYKADQVHVPAILERLGQ